MRSKTYYLLELRTQLNDIYQEENESAITFANQLTITANNIIKLYKIENGELDLNSFRLLVELTLIEYFIIGLKPEISKFLRNANNFYETVLNASKIQENFLNNLPKNNSNNSLNICLLEKLLSNNFQLEEESVVNFANRLRDTSRRFINSHESVYDNITNNERCIIHDTLLYIFENGLRPEIAIRIPLQYKNTEHIVNQAIKAENLFLAKINCYSETLNNVQVTENKDVLKKLKSNEKSIRNLTPSQNTLKDIEKLNLSNPYNDKTLKIIPINLITELRMDFEETKLLDDYINSLPIFYGSESQMKTFIQNCEKLSNMIYPHIELTILKLLINKITGKALKILTNKNCKNIEQLKNIFIEKYISKVYKPQFEECTNSKTLTEYIDRFSFLKEHLLRHLAFCLNKNIENILEQKLLKYFKTGLKDRKISLELNFKNLNEANNALKSFNTNLTISIENKNKIVNLRNPKLLTSNQLTTYRHPVLHGANKDKQDTLKSKRNKDIFLSYCNIVKKINKPILKFSTLYQTNSKFNKNKFDIFYLSSVKKIDKSIFNRTTLFQKNLKFAILNHDTCVQENAKQTHFEVMFRTLARLPSSKQLKETDLMPTNQAYIKILVTKLASIEQLVSDNIVYSKLKSKRYYDIEINEKFNVANLKLHLEIYKTTSKQRNYLSLTQQMTSLQRIKFRSRNYLITVECKLFIIIVDENNYMHFTIDISMNNYNNKRNKSNAKINFIMYFKKFIQFTNVKAVYEPYMYMKIMNFKIAHILQNVLKHLSNSFLNPVLKITPS